MSLHLPGNIQRKGGEVEEEEEEGEEKKTRMSSLKFSSNWPRIFVISPSPEAINYDQQLILKERKKKTQQQQQKEKE